jgi:hypothetical protein
MLLTGIIIRGYIKEAKNMKKTEKGEKREKRERKEKKGERKCEGKRKERD